MEADTAVKESDIGDAWQTRTDTLQNTFKGYKEGITKHLDDYEAERREEVNAFDDRLEVAFETRLKRYDEVSHRYKLRKEIIGLDVPEDDMSSITAANISATYQHFIQSLKNDLTGYTKTDWQLIEGWWNALENRRQAISKELKPTDNEAITEYQQTYIKLREKALNQATTVAG